ncbi:MAG: ABC transporter permease subunit [Candidatus Promineifilaceae bacterium]|nr:ABC transporter permease subunit [Candidatus Promineifilaceae bacterium]
MSKNNKNNGQRGRSRLRLILIVVLVLTVYAIAVQVTEVDLEEPLQPRRQRNLVSLLRDLASPDLFSYENETRSTNISLQLPCPEEIQGTQSSIGDRVLVLAPNCATTTQDPLTLSGQGFAPNVEGLVRWYPVDVQLPRTLTTIRTDDEGNFSTTFTMPDIRESEEDQRVEVVERLSRDIVGLSPTTEETLDRIVETILMALVASTLGTILAVPISFLGARNLMAGVGALPASLMAAIIATPIGYFIGSRVAGFLAGLTLFSADQPWLGLAGVVVLVALIAAIIRFTWRSLESGSAGSRLNTSLRNGVLVLLTILALSILSRLGIQLGLWLEPRLGLFGFIGYALYVASDFVRVFLPALVGLLAVVILASFANRFVQEWILRFSTRTGQIITAILTLVGTATLIFGLAYFVNWICLFGICEQLPESNSALFRLLAIISLAGGALAAGVSLLARPKRLFPIGIVTYTITRGTLNTLRAIEPVIMGFVLVVWVGIGPFAGVLALMLHSIADLGKLFSEQVENIEEGPLEAVTATGANFLQKVVFAVVPQVVPHYTAFIFYRWDINVRLSTIIGFVGGGGIGLILFRSTNLTQYRQAAVMVIAITVVVTLLDYVSSKIRTRII